MGFTLSPLRYPGGKSRLANFIRTVIRLNGLQGTEYVEPFAGGAGIAWALLLDGSVSKVHLNDLDQAVFAFWTCLRDHTEELCRMIRNTRVNMATWKRQKAIMDDPSSHSLQELSFATFFLNRTNCSGVIRGGVIGGQRQAGKWKMDARYNRSDLLKRVVRIAKRRSSIFLYDRDAKAFIRHRLSEIPADAFVFIDPPYVSRGNALYLNVYTEEDHAQLAKLIARSVRQSWVVSYDDSPIIKRLYRGFSAQQYNFSYSVNARYVGSELLFFSRDLSVPREEIPQFPKRPGQESKRVVEVKIRELD